MSDVSGGPGWWQASDGKWYRPEQHPDYRPPSPPPPSPPPIMQRAPSDTAEGLFVGQAPIVPPPVPPSPHSVPARQRPETVPVKASAPDEGLKAGHLPKEEVIAQFSVKRLRVLRDRGRTAKPELFSYGGSVLPHRNWQKMPAEVGMLTTNHLRIWHGERIVLDLVTNPTLIDVLSRLRDQETEALKDQYSSIAKSWKDWVPYVNLFTPAGKFSRSGHRVHSAQIQRVITGAQWAGGDIRLRTRAIVPGSDKASQAITAFSRYARWQQQGTFHQWSHELRIEPLQQAEIVFQVLTDTTQAMSTYLGGVT